mgnify:CR=1 FL=1
MKPLSEPEVESEKEPPPVVEQHIDAPSSTIPEVVQTVDDIYDFDDISG